MNDERIKIVNKTHNSIHLSWENLAEELQLPLGTFYKLQILQELQTKWADLYWGQKLNFQVKELAPFTCYYFRLKYMISNNYSEWIEFRKTTANAPIGSRSLYYSIRFKRVGEIKKNISERFCLLKTENKDQLTPLMQVIQREDIELVTLFLKMGADPNQCNRITKISPLMMAVFYGSLEIATLLIKKGADINFKDISGRNILHHAVDSGKINNVKFALEYSEKINSQDHQGWTPLLRAVILGVNDQIISLLIEKGANKEIKDKNGFDFIKHNDLIKEKTQNYGKEQRNNFAFIKNQPVKRRVLFPKLFTIFDGSTDKDLNDLNGNIIVNVT